MMIEKEETDEWADDDRLRRRRRSIGERRDKKIVQQRADDGYQRGGKGDQERGTRKHRIEESDRACMQLLGAKRSD